MPRKTNPGDVGSIQQQLTEAANAFAREILRILRATTLSDLTALAGKRAPEEAPPEETQRRKRTSPRTSTLRRIAGTKPVTCPVSGCNSPGVRSKMNFCNEHAASLPKAERVKLRQQQRARHVSEPIQLPEAGEKNKKKGTPKGEKKAA